MYFKDHNGVPFFFRMFDLSNKFPSVIILQKRFNTEKKKHAMILNNYKKKMQQISINTLTNRF